MKEERWLSARGQPLGFPVFTDDVDESQFSAFELAERRDALCAEAEADNLQTDLQALDRGIVGGRHAAPIRA